MQELQIRPVECFSGRGTDFRGKIAPPLASCYIYSLASVAFLRWRREMHFPKQHREAFENRTGSVSTRCVFTDFRVTAPVISLLTTHCYFVCPVITGSLNPKMKKDVANRISYNSFQIGPQKVDHCLLISYRPRSSKAAQQWSSGTTSITVLLRGLSDAGVPI
jgi:hypothetical protein